MKTAARRTLKAQATSAPNLDAPRTARGICVRHNDGPASYDIEVIESDDPQNPESRVFVDITWYPYKRVDFAGHSETGISLEMCPDMIAPLAAALAAAAKEVAAVALH